MASAEDKQLAVFGRRVHRHLTQHPHAASRGEILPHRSRAVLPMSRCTCRFPETGKIEPGKSWGQASCQFMCGPVAVYAALAVMAATIHQRNALHVQSMRPMTCTFMASYRMRILGDVAATLWWLYRCDVLHFHRQWSRARRCRSAAQRGAPSGVHAVLVMPRLSRKCPGPHTGSQVAAGVLKVATFAITVHMPMPLCHDPQQLSPT